MLLKFRLIHFHSQHLDRAQFKTYLIRELDMMLISSIKIPLKWCGVMGVKLGLSHLGRNVG
jgi:hypothetical protein